MRSEPSANAPSAYLISTREALTIYALGLVLGAAISSAVRAAKGK